MCDEEPPILLGNSTDAFLKWRSGEPFLLPLSSFLPLPPHFILLFPMFSVCFQHPLTPLQLSAPFNFFLLFSFPILMSVRAPPPPPPSPTLSPLLTTFLSLFSLIRVTHYCCTDCANVTTQSDITDNNKLFPKIASDTVVLLLRSPISLPACGYRVCDFCGGLCACVCGRVLLYL